MEKKVPREKTISLLQRACTLHAAMYKDCMNGKGLDRHLFALYVISKGLDYVSIQGLYEWQGPGQTSVCLICYQQGT